MAKSLPDNVEAQKSDLIQRLQKYYDTYVTPESMLYDHTGHMLGRITCTSREKNGTPFLSIAISAISPNEARFSKLVSLKRSTHISIPMAVRLANDFFAQKGLIQRDTPLTQENLVRILDFKMHQVILPEIFPWKTCSEKRMRGTYAIQNIKINPLSTNTSNQLRYVFHPLSDSDALRSTYAPSPKEISITTQTTDKDTIDKLIGFSNQWLKDAGFYPYDRNLVTSRSGDKTIPLQQINPEKIEVEILERTNPHWHIFLSRTDKKHNIPRICFSCDTEDRELAERMCEETKKIIHSYQMGDHAGEQLTINVLKELLSNFYSTGTVNKGFENRKYDKRYIGEMDMASCFLRLMTPRIEQKPLPEGGHTHIGVVRAMPNWREGEPWTISNNIFADLKTRNPELAEKRLRTLQNLTSAVSRDFLEHYPKAIMPTHITREGAAARKCFRMANPGETSNDSILFFNHLRDMVHAHEHKIPHFIGWSTHIERKSLASRFWRVHFSATSNAWESNLSPELSKFQGPYTVQFSDKADAMHFCDVLESDIIRRQLTLPSIPHGNRPSQLLDTLLKESIKTALNTTEADVIGNLPLIRLREAERQRSPA